jgi:hypothetical protein
MKMTRKKAAMVVGAVLLIGGLPVVMFLGHGFLDEMDFWAGTFGLVVFAMIEVILFAWIFGMKRGWAEINQGADIKIPNIFKFIIQFITPVYLIGLLFAWGVQDGIPVLLMRGKPEADIPYLWGARLMMFGLTVVSIWLIARAYKRGTIRDEVAPDLRG